MLLIQSRKKKPAFESNHRITLNFWVEVFLTINNRSFIMACIWVLYISK